MYYPLANDSWGKEEVEAILRVVTSNRFTMGEEVKKFEEEFAEEFGSKHAIMVNSGSSANLLMIGSMVESGRLEAGDEIIVPAVSWSTTYFPCHQYGLKMVFVDVDRETLNINIEEVEKAITEKTQAIFAVNLLGNPCNLSRLKLLCDSFGLDLLEDNCESLGASVDKKYTGTFGRMGSFSFFFSHHMQTMEGGMILTDDEELAQYCKVMRAHGWLRDLPAENLIHHKTGSTFKDSFKFVVPGYCVRPLEMSGAVGRVQLRRWNDNHKLRNWNSKYYHNLFANQPWCDIQKTNDADASWFGFSLILKGELEGRRDEVVNKLIENGIECRPIVAGNFLNQPVMDRLHVFAHDVPNAEYIDKNGFFLGNNPNNLEEQLTYVRYLIDGILS